MTDLPIILPDFNTTSYSHLIPSLDRHGITVTDLISADTLDVAKRATLPLLEVRRLVADVVAALHSDLNRQGKLTSANHITPSGIGGRSWRSVSLLDELLDSTIGGGIPTGYLTEITGERWVTSDR